MTSMYFVIQPSEDGPSIEMLNEQQLLDKLNGGEWGNPIFLDHIPDDDPQRWPVSDGDYILIIKGEIITPKPVKVVEEYELR